MGFNSIRLDANRIGPNGVDRLTIWKISSEKYLIFQILLLPFQLAMASFSLPFISHSFSPGIKFEGRNTLGLSFSSRLPVVSSKLKDSSNGRRGGRKIWRRRKLMKKDDMLRYKLERVPFLEEHTRKIKEEGQLLSLDIERLLLSEDNRYDFVNEVAAEAKEYVENNRDYYGDKKKAILHVISNRMNDSGFPRPEAYEESDPYKPPGYMKEYYT
ncbi:protein PLASTID TRANSCRIPTIONALLY ACTIVE 7-like [Rutidosis leptorrhynchoides]|uniref:protein PLASTID TRANSCRIPTIONALLY ACTIVE 7-like n=1 Tax=Rutidosis leptorrhynchoides TaxID=125765 RepID=UPI003A9A5BE4